MPASTVPSSGSAGVNVEHPEHSRCLNCGARLTGPYCARCGQKATEHLVPFRLLVTEFLDSLFALDARFFRTMGPLLVKPGYLTNEYLAGRRVRYVSPLRLYLFTSFVFFLLLAALDAAPFQNVYEPPTSAAAEQPTPEELQDLEELPPWLAPAVPSDSAAGDDSMTVDVGDGEMAQAFERNVHRINQNPQEFVRSLQEHMSVFVFVLLPVFALLLKGLYARSGRLYVQHLIFSLHVHAFAFVLFTVTWLLDAFAPTVLTEAVDTIYFWVLLLYLLVAMQRVYGQRLSKTVIKLGMLLTSYAVVFLIAFVGFILTIILMY